MANSPSRDEGDLARNIRIHDRVARRYEAVHGEIFNDVEQARLNASLKRAMGEIKSGTQVISALDVGCGSGNLTRHLLELGARVTAADVSRGFLNLVQSRFPSAPLETLVMNGHDLSNIPDASFDIVATYSVLHHIPKYLTAVAEMARVCKHGGIVVIDHEPTESFWTSNRIYREFQREALKFDWRKYLRPSNYWHRFVRIFYPRHSNEGDIHVWPDDHIEWQKIKDLMARCGFHIVAEDDYLLYRNLYKHDVFERYVGRCTDMKCMIFRKA